MAASAGLFPQGDKALAHVAGPAIEHRLDVFEDQLLRVVLQLLAAALAHYLGQYLLCATIQESRLYRDVDCLVATADAVLTAAATRATGITS